MNNIENITKEDVQIEQEPVQQTQQELRRFSKTYSPEWRDSLAKEIRELRSHHFGEHEDDDKKTEILDVDEKKIERLRGEAENVEKDIHDVEGVINSRKNKILSRMVDFFQKKEIREKLQINDKTRKLEEITKEIEETEGVIKENKDALVDRKHLDEAKQKLDEFYIEQSDAKNAFQAEREVRDISHIADRENVFFIHGISPGGMNKNEILNEKNFETQLNLVVGLEPTISVSTLKEGDTYHHMFSPVGLVFSGGQVLSAHKQSSFLEAKGLYTRQKRGEKTSIQADIENNIQEAVHNRSDVNGTNEKVYNELAIENPKAAAIYVELDTYKKMFSNKTVASEYLPPKIEELEKYAEKTGLPIHGWVDGKLYEVSIIDKEGLGGYQYRDFVVGKEVFPQDISSASGVDEFVKEGIAETAIGSLTSLAQKKVIADIKNRKGE